MSDNPLPGQIALFSVTALCKPDPERLNALRAEAILCHKCELRQSCNQVVFGEGRTDRPLIALVGEAPGADDDAQGKPFVGRAGELLRRMVTAMKIDIADIYFCNIVSCRPPDNRPPTRDEIGHCREWFAGQLRFVQPQTIVALGMTAANALLETRRPEQLHKLRGVWHEWQGIPMRVTFHPNHLHRHPLDKPYAWKDLQEVQAKLEKMRVAALKTTRK